MNKILKIASCVIVAGIIVTVASLAMSVGIAGKFHVGTTSATLNGANAVATGTPFRVSGKIEDVGIFYQAIQATSTPHYKIRLYTSPDNSSYTTNAVATFTPSVDETTTDFINRSVPSLGTSTPSGPWGRIDIEGAALNAEGTTFNLWIYEE